LGRGWGPPLVIGAASIAAGGGRREGNEESSEGRGQEARLWFAPGFLGGLAGVWGQIEERWLARSQPRACDCTRRRGRMGDSSANSFIFFAILFWSKRNQLSADKLAFRPIPGKDL
jgi:hypothetical protein